MLGVVGSCRGGERVGFQGSPLFDLGGIRKILLSFTYRMSLPEYHCWACLEGILPDVVLGQDVSYKLWENEEGLFFVQTCLVVLPLSLCLILIFGLVAGPAWLVLVFSSVSPGWRGLLLVTGLFVLWRVPAVGIPLRSSSGGSLTIKGMGWVDAVLGFPLRWIAGAAVHASNHRSWTGAITMITIFRFVVEEDGHGWFRRGF